MLETLRVYIKVVVDIERGILAGGGEKHAWCEALLLWTVVDSATSGVPIGHHSTNRLITNRLSIFVQVKTIAR